MRHKVVHRWYCDFCKKQGGSAFWIRRHEGVCTNNPKRMCGFCKCAGRHPVSPSKLMVTMKMAGFKSVKAEANGCPACILAFIRQNRHELETKYSEDAFIFSPSNFGGGEVNPEHWSAFDFKKATEEFWKKNGYPNGR